ncbi:hypothetical protein BJ742DRAFT_403526 [Cladochytrium replicatum]|nr:hypothetical protein BJ742DRAFT_403526 [Cladochytrium replicatum]
MQSPSHNDHQNRHQRSSQQYHDSNSSPAYMHPIARNPPPYPVPVHQPRPHHQQLPKSLAMGQHCDDHYDNYAPLSSEEASVHDRGRRTDDPPYSDMTIRHPYQDSSTTPPPSGLPVEKRRRDPEDSMVTDPGPFKKRSYSTSSHGLPQHLQQKSQILPSPTAAQTPSNGQGGLHDGVAQLSTGQNRSHSRSPRPSAPESHQRSPPSDYAQQHLYYPKSTSNPPPPYYPYGPSQGNKYQPYYYPQLHFQPPKEDAASKNGEYKMRYLSMKKQYDYIKRENEMLAEEYAILKSKLKKLKVEKNIVLESLFTSELCQLQRGRLRTEEHD